MSRGTLRLFVAAYPPPEIADRLLGLLRSKTLPVHRPVPAAQVHLTLHFIGDTSERELNSVRESVARSAAGLPAFDLAVSGLATLPERGEARLVAAVADLHPTALELHRRLVRRLARTPRPGERFTPHLTLCRFNPPVRGLRISEPFPPLSWRIAAVRLVRSVLKPGGAEHAAVGEFALDSAGGDVSASPD